MSQRQLVKHRQVIQEADEMRRLADVQTSKSVPLQDGMLKVVATASGLHKSMVHLVAECKTLCTELGELHGAGQFPHCGNCERISAVFLLKISLSFALYMSLDVC